MVSLYHKHGVPRRGQCDGGREINTPHTLANLVGKMEFMSELVGKPIRKSSVNLSTEFARTVSKMKSVEEKPLTDRMVSVRV